MKSRVVLLPCGSYETKEIRRALERGLELLGGFQEIFRSGESVLLKPNLVREAAVERAVITHPAVMGALAAILKDHKITDMVCGDSCGIGSAVKVMQSSGMARALEPSGVRLSDFSEPERVSYRSGGREESFVLAREVLQADALVSVSKMKTHALEHVTGAVKNQYGCICGLHKAKGHTRYPDADSFARMLVHLNQTVKPRLFIMDGVIAMEGNGPTSGDPVPMGLLLLSQDPVALDSVFCRLIHLDPEIVPTNLHGGKMGLGTWREEEIELLTPEGPLSMEEAVARYGKPDFRVERKPSAGRGILGRIGFLRVFRKKPVIDRDKCRKCGICVESCPVDGKAVTFANGRKEPPVYNYKKCIRCFCCQEMCPYKAIRVK